MPAKMVCRIPWMQQAAFPSMWQGLLFRTESPSAAMLACWKCCQLHVVLGSARIL